ncbi:hypothetical protein ACTFIR_010385 [Dictyostelium discoideum]
MNYEIFKKLHGIIETCIVDSDGDVVCVGSSRNYPKPIIEGDFKPPTKGGHSIIKGYYLVLGMDFYKIISNTNVLYVGIPYEKSFDAINLILDYKGGENSSLVVIGSNFCDTSNNVNIFIDGVKIDKVNLISIDHDQFEVRYSEKYSKSIYANSVPKSKGGSITITGQRLSSQINDALIIVKIGNFQFLRVNVSINGEVKLIGYCLGTNESTQVYIDDTQQLNLTTNVNDNKQLYHLHL